MCLVRLSSVCNEHHLLLLLVYVFPRPNFDPFFFCFVPCSASILVICRKVVTKKKETVPKIFKCPYCAHDGSCEVKMDKAAETGTVACRICGESYQARVHYLSDPVDVYCEWIDACEAARDGGNNNGGNGNGNVGAAGGGMGSGGAAGALSNDF